MIINEVDIIFLGSEYKGTKYTGHDLGIAAHFHDRSHGYSSTELKKRIKAIDN